MSPDRAGLVMDIAMAQDDSSAGRRRGVRSVAPDEDLSRLGAAFARLDAALLAGDRSDELYDRWWGAVQDALLIRARAARGRRIKARMLLAVIRETRAIGVVCDLARSVANDLTGRVGRKKKPLSPTEVTIQHFMEQGLSRRAAGLLTAHGCRDADEILRLELDDGRPHPNCGPVTKGELRAFARQRRRLQGGNSEPSNRR
jgi:hypothetical protein